MYADGYARPKEDRNQDVTTGQTIGTHVNGVLRAAFTRKRNTKDSWDDRLFSDNPQDCFYFLFPVTGGRLNGEYSVEEKLQNRHSSITEHGDITKHIGQPLISTQKICIKSCGKDNTPKQMMADKCITEYRFPPACEGTACDYIARWKYSPVTSDVRFEISARDPGRWTGIGFSRDGNMVGTILLKKTLETLFRPTPIYTPAGCTTASRTLSTASHMAANSRRSTLESVRTSTI